METVARRECPPSVLARNKSFVKRELRACGIALTPESGLVVRLPAGAYWNKIDVTMVLRKTLQAFYIPLCVCDCILQNRCVIQQVPSSVDKELDTCRVWTGRINNSEPTLCGHAAFQ